MRPFVLQKRYMALGDHAPQRLAMANGVRVVAQPHAHQRYHRQCRLEAETDARQSKTT
jgi:hypothetical protein